MGKLKRFEWTGTVGVLNAQTQINSGRNSFYLAPGPSDFATAIERNPEDATAYLMRGTALSEGRLRAS